MDFWEHRAVQDKCDLADLKAGTVRDDEDPPQEMDRTRLSPRQMLALKAFHAGSSLKDAAKAAGVTRQTLHRWRTVYHAFSEAMEVWEEGQMIIARSRLVDMADNAIDTLANVIADGDARAAMMVLRSLRILRTYGPLKPPAEGAAREARHAGIALPCDSGTAERESIEERHEGTPACRDLAAARGNEPAASEEGGNIAASAGTVAGKIAPEQHAPGKIAPAAAQHPHFSSNPPAERPKMAISTEKARSAIKMACDSAFQDATGFDEMLHANQG